jgi:nucleolar GTP-binding protein
MEPVALPLNGKVGKERLVQRTRTGYAPTKHDQDADAVMDDGNKKKTARDLMWENGGPGVWAPDYREQYDLKDEAWRFDAIPQILDGKNIADYVDPEIEAKLLALEEEEEQLVAELEAAAMGEESESDLDEEEEAAVHAIRERKIITRQSSRTNQTINKPVVPRSVRGRGKDKHDRGALNADDIKKKMDGYGVDTSLMLERGRETERGRKRERSMSVRRMTKTTDGDDVMSTTMDEDMKMDASMSNTQLKKVKKAKKDSIKRESSLARSHSRIREPSEMGLKDEAAARIAKKLDKAGRTNWEGLSGEGDQRKSVHLVKWMNTGKKRNGTNYCR